MARLATGFLLVVAPFVVGSLWALFFVYTAVLGFLTFTGFLADHLRFVLVVTTPLLIALLVVWGWAVQTSQVPVAGMSGVTYAFFVWLRICTAGAALQWLFLPLLKRPARLRDFMNRCGISGPIGVITVSAVIFLPEVRRRLERIADARKAQGYPVRGLGGLRGLPKMLMPLVSSLLDSASSRAEFWLHRGVFRARAVPDVKYSWRQGAVALACSSALFLATALL